MSNSIRFVLNSACKYLSALMHSDRYIKVFTARERQAIQDAYEAIESATHYPESF